MKKKIIVWGTGSGFIKRAAWLEQNFQIIAFTDNHAGGGKTFRERPYLRPSDIPLYEFDEIIVCSLDYYETIKYQLVTELSIEADKICSASMMRTPSGTSEGSIFETVDKYRSQNKDDRFLLKKRDMWLIASDYDKEAAAPMEHYFAQDIWAARHIFEQMPADHYDIGSRLDGFLAHLLVFLPSVTYIDVRPLPFKIDRLSFLQGNASNLSGLADSSVSSLSSLHAVEHFGLGRYGDPVEPDAWFKALMEFERVLAPGGRLYLGVPVGPANKLIFNAHRIFRPDTIISSFQNLTLTEFSLIKKGAFTWDVTTPDELSQIIPAIPEYSCGLYVFTKPV